MINYKLCVRADKMTKAVHLNSESFKKKMLGNFRVAASQKHEGIHPATGDNDFRKMCLSLTFR